MIGEEKNYIDDIDFQIALDKLKFMKIESKMSKQEFERRFQELLYTHYTKFITAIKEESQEVFDRWVGKQFNEDNLQIMVEELTQVIKFRFDSCPMFKTPGYISQILMDFTECPELEDYDRIDVILDGSRYIRMAIQKATLS